MILNSISAWKKWAKTFPAKADKDVPYRSPFHVLNNGSETEDAEILVYDVIGRDFWSGEGMAAKDFAEKLKEVDPKARLIVGINSPGGNVDDGLAIFNMLERRGNVETRNDGMAASIASVILQAGDKRKTSESAMVMIHRAWGLMVGNATDAEQFSEVLKKHDQVIAETYARKSGKTAEYFLEQMDAETFYTGNEAKEAGLVDEVFKPETKAKNLAPAGAALQNKPLAATARSGQAQSISNGMKPEGNQPKQEPASPQGKGENNKMNKSKIVALLKKHGIEANETETEEQLQAKLDSIPAAKPDNEASSLRDELNEVKAQAEKERTNRIERTIDNLAAEGKITAEEGKQWLPKCIADESLLEILAARPALPQGAAPLPIITASKGIVEKFKAMKPGKERFAFLRENFQNLQDSFRSIMSPMNANTHDSALVTAILGDGIITIMGNKLAMLGAFSRNFSTDSMKPSAKVQVKKATAGATGSQNPTNFQTGDSTVDNVEVTVNYENLSYHISSVDRQNGLMMADLAQINAEAFANQLSDRVTALMVAGNYGAATAIGANTAFSLDGTKPILALAKNYRRKQLLLDGGHLAYIQPNTTEQVNWRTNGALGFDMIGEQNRWTSAEANTAGFVCGPDAVAVAAGLPKEVPSRYYESIQTFDVGLGLTVAVHMWFDTASRQTWASYGLMFGAAAGDTTQAEVLVTA